MSSMKNTFQFVSIAVLFFSGSQAIALGNYSIKGKVSGFDQKSVTLVTSAGETLKLNKSYFREKTFKLGQVAVATIPDQNSKIKVNQKKE